MAISEGKFITSGNLRLWTERFGHPADPVVLLIMGTSTPGIGWPDELVETLVAGGRQVMRYDHRDTGRSDCVDFAAHPYTLGDLAGDALAVLDAYGVASAHIAGVSLGGAIAQWLAAHRPERVATLTAIMTGPMGADAGPAWARAMAGEEPDPDDLPPPAPYLLQHFLRAAATPPATREEAVAAGVETWRALHGGVLPFDERAARRLAEEGHDRTANPAAAANHDLAGRKMTEDRLVPLSSIKAPALVVHGTADPLRPLPHGEALAAAIPQARLEPIDGMGHSLLSPGLPRRVAELILRHTG
ncbi:alpha/beta fold hydrolase [Nonomuraea terrae]|uniref:Alpha/beta fold hydrolase n=1 Tax=Nonomuraea terrae TaxID=2530383 RepID=A0A4R4YI92_9ACTN|nr:alpha/beta fold hydrolase [Nonomuraea terrae]TDD44553.1 alpha/beta fold hydrolase [Nonomuraea terrae]